MAARDGWGGVLEELAVWARLWLEEVLEGLVVVGRLVGDLEPGG